MKIILSDEAESDLEDIVFYIAQNNPESALKTYDRIIKAAYMLEDHPHLGRGGRLMGTRELVVSGLPYILPYRVKGDTVQILRIYHAARQWPEEII